MPISVLLADDSVIVREGVRALLEMEADIDVIAVAGDYQELIDLTERTMPQVVVTDVRMPPSFHTEGIDAAREVRRRHPGTGVVVLSQYDDPEYVVSLVEDGSDGCAYLLKERVAEGGQLARAVRVVSTGGSMLDSEIVKSLVPDFSSGDQIDGADNDLLRLLTRMLPPAITEKLRLEDDTMGRTEVRMATVLVSDVRGYCTIAERSDPRVLAAQLSEHRAEMNTAVTAAGGTVMHFMGDAVLAVFGAPVRQRQHADQALTAARDMLQRQTVLNKTWGADHLPAFGLGLGLSTGSLAAAFLGSEDRVEYTVVGDSVNLAHRLQQHARAGQIILSEASLAALSLPTRVVRLDPLQIRGRRAPETAFLIEPDDEIHRTGI
jgi:class 3 adenylate cyclase